MKRRTILKRPKGQYPWVVVYATPDAEDLLRELEGLKTKHPDCRFKLGRESKP